MVAGMLSEYVIYRCDFVILERNVSDCRGTIVYLTDWCDSNSDNEDDPKGIIQNMLCYGNIILQ
jgi:hypothetical protein